MVWRAGLAALLAGVAAPAFAGACDDLARLALPQVTITGAHEVAADTGLTVPGLGLVKLPFAVCKIEATARPSRDSDIRIAVMIPIGAAWNGKFVQVGNGGFAGQIPLGTMLLGVTRGYAVAGTDDGHHSSDSTDASWALGHPEKVVDFGWRALKSTTDAAKAIITRYAAAPKRAYFVGCSDGGREALMTAQRQPQDFEGIVAGAPAWPWTRMLGVSAKAAQAATLPGHALPPAKLPALQAAALKACGGGQSYIADPRACRFDPGVLKCDGAETDACLTDGQLATVRAAYTGIKDPVSGKRFPGLEPGAEALPNSWTSWGLASPEGDTSRATKAGFAWNHFAYLVKDDPGLDLRSVSDADIIAGHKRWASTLNADSTDLSAFKARGGKLVQYHGWNDPAIPPRLSLAYHGAVQKSMGRTDGFYRLFMVPGMLHCRGGDAPTEVDWFSVIDQWVETGTAPDSVAARGKAGSVQTVRAEP